MIKSPLNFGWRSRCQRRAGVNPVAIAVFGVTVVFMAPRALQAQDALLHSHNSLGNALVATPEDQPYTVHWGDARLLVGASLDSEWNDNVNLASTAPQEDFISRPMVNGSLYLPVTDLNVFNVSIGVGYEKYWLHPDYDRVIVSPGSQLSWDVTIKNFKINFHDQFSYYEDPTAVGSISGVTRFGGFENTIGLLGTWDLDDVTLSLGYDHYNFIASTAQYGYTTHASEYVTARLGARIYPGALTGIESSMGPTTYDQSVLQNNFTYSLGVFAEWQVTEFISTQLRAGYYWYDFDVANSAPASKESGYYLSLNYDHNLRQNLTLHLEAGRQTSMGIYSSLTEEWYGQGGINWRLIHHITANASLRYETVTQPIILQFSDNYERMSVDFKISMPFNEKLTGSLEYRYWLKNSNLLTDEDYKQNMVTLQFTYHF